MKNQIITTISLCVLALGINSCASKKNSSLHYMVARMEIKEPIEDLCEQNNVIMILPLSGNGQVKAIAPKTKEELSIELNNKVSFLKNKTDYEDKGMVKMVINCKGDLVLCKMSNNTQSTELDSQIEAVFAELKKWTPGSIHNKPFDTVELYSFTISNGKISLK